MPLRTTQERPLQIQQLVLVAVLVALLVAVLSRPRVPRIRRCKLVEKLCDVSINDSIGDRIVYTHLDADACGFLGHYTDVYFESHTP